MEGEAIHCRQALRKTVGEQIFVTDGKGRAFKTTIVSMGKKRIDCHITDEIQLSKSRSYQIHIAIAPTKNISRFEWFLEKATELGIDTITPILCQRSERKVIKPERLEKILISAMKQSLKSTLPVLKPLQSLKDFVSQDFSGQKMIGHLEDENTKLLSKVYDKGSNVNIMIGPEGDFSPDEIKLAMGNGFMPISLGDYRLRTETAGISAVQFVHFCNF